MILAFDARRLRTTLRSAAIGLAALLAAPLLAPAAIAAPARPGAVAVVAAPIETVAARRVSRAKATRGRFVTNRRYGRRYGRRGGRDAVILGAMATGVVGAIIAGQNYRDPYDEPGPAYVQYPYGYGEEPGYVRRPHRQYYQQGEGYDRRYWRGGPPREAAPVQGYAPPRNYGQPRHYEQQRAVQVPRGPGPGGHGPGGQPGWNGGGRPVGPGPGWGGGGPIPGVPVPSTSYGNH